MCMLFRVIRTRSLRLKMYDHVVLYRKSINNVANFHRTTQGNYNRGGGGGGGG